MAKYWVRTPWWLKMAFPKDLVWEMPAENEPSVYITFDDGPHPSATPFALEQLAKYNAKATFFCVGENVTRYPDVYNQILQQGHTTANHTFNHMNGWKTGTDTYLRNIDKAEEHIHSTLFRPPYGRIKRSQAKMIGERHPGWKIIMWDVLAGDFDKQITPEQCLDNVLSNIKPGSIIVFHDSDKAWERMSYTLPLVLGYCSKQNWNMKAIPS